MPPKKKSKTSTPATLPCFATARLTIIGANPVQRKIWQKCGGPIFLKPSQVSQLTNDRDYVVVAAAVVVAILVSLGSASLPSQITFFASIAPVCVALGVPAAPLGLLIAVETIPDIFRTLGNVSMDLAATVTVSRWSGTTGKDVP